MARTIRVCVKQRHKILDIDSRISSSEAFGFSSSSTLVVRITPLRQNPHWAAPADILTRHRETPELMRLFRSSQSLKGSNLLLFYCADWHHAGPHRLPLNQDGAASALRQPTAELGSTQLEFVAEDIKQRSFGIDIHCMSLAVHLQRNSRHHLTQRSRMYKYYNGFVSRKRSSAGPESLATVIL